MMIRYASGKLAFLALLLGAALAMPLAVAGSDTGDAALIEQGKYMTDAANCAACHTTRDGKLFAGGRSVETPFGKIYSTNITPDDETGIGDWTFDDFWDALHDGRGKGGELLYPAFPYTSYTKITRDDARAMFAYLQSVPAVRQADKTHGLRFPYNVRSGLHVWRTMYFDKGEFEPDPEQSDAWNRGAYLVSGPGHCNECHTARTWLGGMKDDQFLAGGEIPVQGWFAPDLSMQEGGGLEGWTKRDVVDLLQHGRSTQGAVYGPMAEVVKYSTQHLHADDLHAIAEYLATLPAPASTSSATITPADDYDEGKALYASYCADCHAADGSGKGDVFPPLDGNRSIQSASGINAIRVVLMGGFAPSTKTNPRPYSMPPFADTLSNADVAAVVNYIRQSWSNEAASVSAEDVSGYRSLVTD